MSLATGQVTAVIVIWYRIIYTTTLTAAHSKTKVILENIKI